MSNKGPAPGDPRSSGHLPNADQPRTPPDGPDHPEGAIVLFDGVCNLCHGAVRFILKRDGNGHFRFASLQSETGHALLARHFADPGDIPDSMVLIEQGKAHVASDAVLRILPRLGPGWRLLSPLRLVPRVLRDAVYRLVARHRYRLFGRQDQCLIPTPDLQSRFLD